MAKKRGLAANRGLDALLGSIKKEKAITKTALKDDTVGTQTDKNDVLIDTSCKVDSTQPLTASTPLSVDTPNTHQTHSDSDICLIRIDVARLQAGKYQPRRDMNEPALRELATSIEKHGVMQPIVIRPLLLNEEKTDPKVTHEIIAGERRWRAAKMANESTIPAIERALSDELAIALALIENIQREDLSVIEQAAALQRFHTEFGMSHTMIADVVGKARTTVSNLLRLNQLHETVKDHLNAGDLDMGHARALLSLPKSQQPIIATKIIDGSMTVRDAEQLVKSLLNPEPNKQRSQANGSISKLSERLSDKLGAKVKLKQKKDGKGSMEIFFYSHDELDSLLEQLSVKE